MAQAKGSLPSVFPTDEGVSLHVAASPSENPTNPSAPGLDSCAPNNETPREARESICQNSAFSPSPLVQHKYLDTPANRLLVEFIELHLGIQFQGFQAGYKGLNRTTPDLVLFTGPHHSTLAVEVSLISESREVARATVREKILAAEKKFRVSEPISPRREGTEATDSEAIAWG